VDIFSRLRFAIILLLAVLFTGVLGYRILMGWGYLDALYMTVITISTVGFREVTSLTPGAKIFTLLIIVGGAGTVFYTLGTVVEFMVEGHLRGFVGERRMQKGIARLENHFILCGYGKVGKQVAREFARVKSPFIVIENDPEVALECKVDGLLYLQGDASDSEVLKTAGIEKAQGLVAAVDTDAENVFVTLTARELNPNIFIVARSNREESEEKLIKAGADRVITPTAIGGRRMAALLTRPLVCDYLDIVCHGEELEFRLEEITIDNNSSLANTTLEKANIRNKTGTLVLAVKNDGGEMNTNPSPLTEIKAGDILVVIGTKNQLEKLQSMI